MYRIHIVPIWMLEDYLSLIFKMTTVYYAQSSLKQDDIAQYEQVKCRSQ